MFVHIPLLRFDESERGSAHPLVTSPQPADSSEHLSLHDNFSKELAFGKIQETASSELIISF